MSRLVSRIVWMLPAGAIVALLAGPAPSAGAAGKTLVVEAGDRDRLFTPMAVDLPAGATAAAMTADGKVVPCQVVEGRLCFILDALAAGQSRTFTITLGADAAAPAGVALAQTDKTVDITIAGQPFTTYHFTNPKFAGQQLRRPYFFPVFGPGQTPMTRPYPLTDDPIPANVAKDHPHHTSLWVAHGDVNGVDDWSIGDKAGWMVHREFAQVASGPVVGWFRERLDWTDADSKPVLREERTIRVWNLPADHRMLDMDLLFEAAYGKATFGDTKEGGLCSVRVRPEFRADGKGGAKGRLVNSEGQTGADAWGKKATWCDASGPVDGTTLGLALFDHPENLRHPTPWHARTYGLVTANPFGLSHFTGKKEKGDFTLEAGQTLRQRYRIYFHRGDEKEAKVDDRWADFATPPKATWK